MRKANPLARRSGRNKKEAAEPSNNNATPRKVTPEEASLTAKNYRLAKELSELRVRHREECKNVTRLQMENMNLASRCRKAIGHVHSLKKELTLHRQQQQPNTASLSLVPTAKTVSASLSSPKSVEEPVSPFDGVSSMAVGSSTSLGKYSNSSRTGGSLPSGTNARSKSNSGDLPSPSSEPSPRPMHSDVVAEMERMERILDETEKAPASPAMASQSSEDDEEDEPLSTPVDSDDFEESAEHSFFRTYNEEFPGDLSVAQRRAAARKPRLDGFSESDDGEPTTNTSTRPRRNLASPTPATTTSSSSSSSILSSIDAFEASFATSFPESFSPAMHSYQSSEPLSEEKKTNTDPFFPSPVKEIREESPTTTSVTTSTSSSIVEENKESVAADSNNKPTHKVALFADPSSSAAVTNRVNHSVESGAVTPTTAPKTSPSTGTTMATQRAASAVHRMQRRRFQQDPPAFDKTTPAKATSPRKAVLMSSSNNYQQPSSYQQYQAPSNESPPPQPLRQARGGSYSTPPQEAGLNKASSSRLPSLSRYQPASQNSTVSHQQQLGATSLPPSDEKTTVGGESSILSPNSLSVKDRIAAMNGPSPPPPPPPNSHYRMAYDDEDEDEGDIPMHSKLSLSPPPQRPAALRPPQQQRLRPREVQPTTSVPVSSYRSVTDASF